MPRCDAEVQKAVITALAAHSPLTALLAGGVAGVREFVRADTAFPYVVLADIASSPFDTQGDEGFEVVTKLEIYSRKPGGLECRTLLAKVQEALLAETINVEGQQVVDLRLAGGESRLMEDGQTYRASLMVRIFCEPV